MLGAGGMKDQQEKLEMPRRRSSLRHRLNPIPTGLCHVIAVYGLIQPIASRNRVKCFHYNCKTNVTSTLHKISFSKEFA